MEIKDKLVKEVVDVTDLIVNELPYICTQDEIKELIVKTVADVLGKVDDLVFTVDAEEVSVNLSKEFLSYFDDINN